MVLLSNPWLWFALIGVLWMMMPSGGVRAARRRRWR